MNYLEIYFPAENASEILPDYIVAKLDDTTFEIIRIYGNITEFFEQNFIFADEQFINRPIILDDSAGEN
jgi:hypothetical protein